MALPPGIKPPLSERPGVPTPYVAHVHPYPTRYHGGIWTRPVFGFPYVKSPQSVFKPDDFAPAAYARYPWAKQSTSGLGYILPPLSKEGVGAWAVIAGIAAVAFFAGRESKR